MDEQRNQRARWIAAHVLPLEPGLRAWLGGRLTGLPGVELDDIVQEAYAQLGGLPSVDHIRSVRAYLFQTAHSLVMAHYRRARIVPIDYLADLDRPEPQADAPSPEAEASGRQELRLLGELVAALPDRQGEAFRLLKLEGLSQRAAAARMGVSESTVEKHIARALHTLMRKLGRGGSERARASMSDQAKSETGRLGTTRDQR